MTTARIQLDELANYDPNLVEQFKLYLAIVIRKIDTSPSDKKYKDTIHVPALLSKQINGRKYAVIPELLTKAGYLTRIKRFKTKYHHYTYEFKVNIERFSGLLKGIPEMFDQADIEIEKFNKRNNPFRDREESRVILRDNLKVTTYYGVPVNYGTSVDPFGGRFHNFITRLKKEERANLRMDGERIFELDIKQCQPKLAATVFKANNVGYSFIDAIKNHDIYEFMMDEEEKLTGKRCTSRDKYKPTMYKTMFGKSYGKKSKKFYKLFPDTEKFLRKIKTTKDKRNPSRKIYSNFACYLQRAESSMLNEVILACDKENIRLLSIHDSILVKESDIDAAYKIFMSIASKHIDNPIINNKPFA